MALVFEKNMAPGHALGTPSKHRGHTRPWGRGHAIPWHKQETAPAQPL